MKKSVLSLFALLFVLTVNAVCPPGLSEVIVRIVADNYPQETSWEIADNTGTIIASGLSTGDTICVAQNSCAQFTIRDSFGDGIFTPGGYYVYVDGVLIAQGAAFGFIAQHQFNCPQGSFCTLPIPLTTAGTYTADFDDTWYTYTPGVTGTYNFTTCSLNTCNTQIWLYTTCPSLPLQEGPAGTFAYNDDNNCGTQANMDVVLVAGTRYLVRIGDNLNDCAGPIQFTFSYAGPVTGCMDPAACNYNPVATASNGNCVYPPSPLCNGPDLQLDSLALVSTLSIMTRNATTCDVDEGCVLGYGVRQVITFRTKINNIGTQDFYIGSPSSQPGQFNLNNCHGHAHYEGYGDYRLSTLSGIPVPAGHKNGFCVIDLCGFGQYTCGNMGISVGCYDAYGSGTQCQWLDVTDVPDGDYRMAILVNSRHLPDALGRYEINFANNVVQICINLSRSTGTLVFTRLPNCTPYVDCLGVPAGTAEMDCNGLCNGPGIYGDAYNDAQLNSQDVSTYMDFIEGGLPPSICYDLNGDARISVYDASLVNWCQRGNPSNPASIHNHCNFPRNIQNPSDSVGLAIKSINLTNNYIDVEISNPTANVKAYQFSLSGVTISSVVSLADPINFPVDVRFRSATNEVFAISVEDSSIQRSFVPQDLVRIYYSAITDTAVCINLIKDVINQDAEKTNPFVYGNCKATTITGLSNLFKPADLVVIPNPASDKAFLHLSNGKANEISVFDAAGKLFNLTIQPIRENWYELDLHELPVGVYFIIVNGTDSRGATRLVKM